MKVVGVAAAFTLAANDVSPVYVAWVIVGAVLLALAGMLIVRAVLEITHRRSSSSWWPYVAVIATSTVWAVGGVVAGVAGWG